MTEPYRLPSAKVLGVLVVGDDGPKFPSGFRIPQTFLIDRSGRLLANRPGEWDWTSASIKALIGRLLDGS